MANYQCPGCAETMNIGSETICPLCDTPIMRDGGGTSNTVLCRLCNHHAPLDASRCPHCGKTLAAGGGFWVLIPILFLIFISVAGILAAIAIPNFTKARSKAQQRACYANQKTIAGATEMYNLDYNTRIHDLSNEFMTKLVSDGYLRSIPQCPSDKSGKQCYSMTPDGTVICSQHGSVSGGRYQVERP